MAGISRSLPASPGARRRYDNADAGSGGLGYERPAWHATDACEGRCARHRAEDGHRRRRQLNKRWQPWRPEGSIVPAPRAARRTILRACRRSHGLRPRPPSRATPRAGVRDPTRRRPFPLPPSTFPAIFESTVRTSATSIASPRRLPPRPPRSPRTPSGLRSHLPSPATPRAGARDPRRRQLFPPPNRSPHLGPTPTRRAHLALLGRVGIPADYRAARQGRRGRVRGTGGRDGQEEDFGHDHGFDYDFG